MKPALSIARLASSSDAEVARAPAVEPSAASTSPMRITRLGPNRSASMPPNRPSIMPASWKNDTSRLAETRSIAKASRSVGRAGGSLPTLSETTAAARIVTRVACRDDISMPSDAQCACENALRVAIRAIPASISTTWTVDSSRRRWRCMSGTRSASAMYTKLLAANTST